MNLPSFIARRISSKDKENLSGPAVRIAIAAIALGLSVMIISIAVLVGFQTEIREKVIGFSAHIQIDNFDDNASFEAAPVSMDQPFYPELEEQEGIRHIQVFALKAGILKTEDQIHGVVLKGVGPDFDWEFFRKYLVEGQIINPPDTGTSDDILLSKTVARKLKLHPGDKVRMYFLSGSEAQPRGRMFFVSGIYETGLEEFDNAYVIGDLRHIQKLNNWDSLQVSGFEVFLDDFKQLDKLAMDIYQQIGYNLNAETVTESLPSNIRLAAADGYQRGHHPGADDRRGRDYHCFDTVDPGAGEDLYDRDAESPWHDQQCDPAVVPLCDREDHPCRYAYRECPGHRPGFTATLHAHYAAGPGILLHFLCPGIPEYLAYFAFKHRGFPGEPFDDHAARLHYRTDQPGESNKV